MYCYNGVLYLYYMSVFVVVIRFEVFARSPPLVARLANRAPCLWGHQDAATSATEALRAVFADNRAPATFMPATRIVFTHMFYLLANPLLCNACLTINKFNPIFNR